MSEKTQPHKRNTSHLTIRRRSPLSHYSDGAYRILAQWLDVDRSLLIEAFKAIANDEAYHHYRIPKKDSREWREIHDPYGGLKEIQRRILDRLLYSIPVSNAAHGAIPGRSVVTNALEHLPDAKEVLTLDIRKAFPSVRFSRVHRIFRKLVRPILKQHAPLPPHQSSTPSPLDEAIHLLTTYCTYPYRPLQGKKTTQKIWTLPQGAPTSGYILNLVCLPLDRKIFKILEQYPTLKLRYSRYLDDLTISSTEKIPPHLQYEIERAIIKNDFQPNHKKTHLFTQNEPVTICGVRLQENKLAADPDLIQRCRKIIQQATQTTDQRLIQHEHKKIRGIISFFKMIYGSQLPQGLAEDYEHYRKIRNLPEEPTIESPVHPLVAPRFAEAENPHALLAQWLDISPELVQKAHQLALSPDGYETWTISKKNGKQRLISSPKTELKEVQSRILTRLLYHIHVSVAAHGFVPSRSIVTNARVHLNAQHLINLDLKDAFPSVNKRRVQHILTRGIGSLIKKFGLRCPTTMRTDLINLIADLVTYNNELPQGAPTSGYLLNLACFVLDQRLFKFISQKAPTVSYSRYADDLSFSSQQPFPPDLLKNLQNIINNSGFRWNPEKTHVAHLEKGQHIEVCGIRIVGNSLHIPKEKIRRYRSIIRQAAHTLPTGSLDDETRNRIQGIVGFVQMIYGDLPRKIALPYKTFLEQHPEAIPTGAAHQKISLYPSFDPS